MKRIVALLVLLAGSLALSVYLLIFLIELRGQSDTERQPRRLESVILDPNSGEIRWTVSVGEEEGQGVYKPIRFLPEYRIDLKKAVMSVEKGADERRFDAREIALIYPALEALLDYARQSTLWWEAGKGEPVGKPKKHVATNNLRARPSN